MFIDPKTGQATLKQSERNQLISAAALLKQIAKFTGVRAAEAAVGSIEVTLDELKPKTAEPQVAGPTTPSADKRQESLLK